MPLERLRTALAVIDYTAGMRDRHRTASILVVSRKLILGAIRHLCFYRRGEAVIATGTRSIHVCTVGVDKNLYPQ